MGVSSVVGVLRAQKRLLKAGLATSTWTLRLGTKGLISAYCPIGDLFLAHKTIRTIREALHP
jgi:hypothetical protein